MQFNPHDLPLKGFIETSFIDWKGRLSSVVFSGGCNFRCPFCHNSALVLSPESLADVPLEHLFSRLQTFRKWVEGVVVTGGEPTMHRGLPAFVDTLKKRGLKVKLDTNGSHPEVLRDLLKKGLLDYIAMDVKGPLNRYERWCGVEVDKARIRESIDLILEGSVEYEFRMTFVPFLHREEDALQVAEEISPARQFFLQEFVPRDTLSPKLSHVKPFSPEKMAAVREGVRAVFEHAQVRSHLHE